MQLTDKEIMMILGFIATLIAVVTPIIKLNATIVRLNITLESFQRQTMDNHNELKRRVDKHGLEIDELGDTQMLMLADFKHIKTHIDRCDNGGDKK